MKTTRIYNHKLKMTYEALGLKGLDSTVLAKKLLPTNPAATNSRSKSLAMIIEMSDSIEEVAFLSCVFGETAEKAHSKIIKMAKDLGIDIPENLLTK